MSQGFPNMGEGQVVNVTTCHKVSPRISSGHALLIRQSTPASYPEASLSVAAGRMSDFSRCLRHDGMVSPGLFRDMTTVSVQI